MASNSAYIQGFISGLLKQALPTAQPISPSAAAAVRTAGGGTLSKLKSMGPAALTGVPSLVQTGVDAFSEKPDFVLDTPEGDAKFTTYMQQLASKGRQGGFPTYVTEAADRLAVNPNNAVSREALYNAWQQARARHVQGGTPGKPIDWAAANAAGAAVHPMARADSFTYLPGWQGLAATDVGAGVASLFSSAPWAASAARFAGRAAAPLLGVSEIARNQALYGPTYNADNSEFSAGNMAGRDVQALTGQKGWAGWNAGLGSPFMAAAAPIASPMVSAPKVNMAGNAYPFNLPLAPNN